MTSVGKETYRECGLENVDPQEDFSAETVLGLELKEENGSGRERREGRGKDF